MLAEDRVEELVTDKQDFLQHAQALQLGGRFHNLITFSQKAKRVSYSTSHAECNAAARLVPMGSLAAMRYTEPELAAALGRSPKAQDFMAILDDASCPFRHDHFIECMDLWELCCGCKGIPHRQRVRFLGSPRREKPPSP